MTITVWKSILKNTLRTQFIFVKEKAWAILLRWEIMRSYYKQKCQEGDEESQKRANIETAARLMRSDIKSQDSTVTNQYPSSDDLKLDSSLSFIPTSLQTTLGTLFVGKDTRRKVAAVGLAIIQAVRPRAVTAPLQIGLAVQIQHPVASELNDPICHSNECQIGSFSSEATICIVRRSLWILFIKWDSVHRTRKWSDLKKCSADCVEPDVLGGDVDLLDMSVLFAADNVDHNIITIDGKGTSHGMCVIAAVTPGKQTNHLIPRRQISKLKTENKTKIPILEYRFAKHACHEVVIEDLPGFLDSDNRIDILWEVSLGFKEATPHWQGMMHILHQGSQHPGQSSVKFLSMINLHSGEKSCIVSTLDFICKRSTMFPPL